ncbi:MAG TPA: DALR anticodon-binding domain-containing protein [Candidatus Obscuribacterales bacterium]
MKIILKTTDSPAIRQLLLNRLQAAISLYTETLPIGVDELTNTAGIKPESIPLYRVEDDMVYKSAIALQLASLYRVPALAIATKLADYLSASGQESFTQPVLNLIIKVVNPGWIYFQLTDQAIATWLQHLFQTPANLLTQGDFANRGERETVPDSHAQITLSLFPVQYAHARCCSILRLGHQQGIIKLSNPTQRHSWRVIEPNPIVWLNAAEQLHLVHPAEKCLIAKLLGALDEISASSQATRGGFLYTSGGCTPNFVKLGYSLSDAMLNFYSSCRILGEVQSQTPHLAQVRLGLVEITQSFLWHILQDRLGVLAPVEL